MWIIRTRKRFIWVVISVLVGITLFSAMHRLNAPKLIQVHEPAMISRTVLVSIPGLSFVELMNDKSKAYPHVANLLENGFTGAMNVRTKQRGVEDSYLSIGLSHPATAIRTIQAYDAKQSLNAYGQHWTATQWYEQLQGMQGKRERNGERGMTEEQDINGGRVMAEVLVPEIGKLGASWGHADQSVVTLGDLLVQAGISTHVFGNRDRGLYRHAIDAGDESRVSWQNRHAPFMLMQHDGKVMKGEVGAKTLKSDLTRPFGVHTDYDWMTQQLQALPKPAVALFELGDLDRLTDRSLRYSPAYIKKMEQTTMKEVDAWLGEVMDHLQPDDRLVVFSPYVNSAAYRERWMLAPLLIWQPGQELAGSLTSPTTRRTGIVSLYDLAPTILQQYGLQQAPGMIGRPLQADLHAKPFKALQQRITEMQKIYELRPKLLYPFVSYEITVLLLGLLSVLLPFTTIRKWLFLPLISLLTAPIWMLVMGWAIRWPAIGLTLLFIIGTLGSSFLLVLWSKRKHRSLVEWTGWIGFVGMGLIVLDLCTQAYAMKHSILGYDAMVGARYYGIGNEYMGVLVGSTVLAVSVWVQFAGSQLSTQWRNRMKIVIAVVFALLIYMLASPSWGTNAGGAITAAAAFGTVWVRMFAKRIQNRRNRLRLFMYAVTITLSSVLVLGVLNVFFLSNEADQSHIGRALQLVFDGHLDIIGEIIMRKLSMNGHLIVVSSWSKVLITSLVVMGVVLFYPLGVFRQWQHEYPHVMYGFSANTTGALVALAVNDSGIVAAATMIVYVAVPMLLLKLAVK